MNNIYFTDDELFGFTIQYIDTWDKTKGKMNEYHFQTLYKLVGHRLREHKGECIGDIDFTVYDYFDEMVMELDRLNIMKGDEAYMRKWLNYQVPISENRIRFKTRVRQLQNEARQLAHVDDITREYLSTEKYAEYLKLKEELEEL